MMSNENPHQPSEKVMEAIIKYGAMANRYPDQGLVVRSKIAEINGLDGPENVMIGNGSSEVFDNIFRMFLEPGQEVIQHTPCFGIYKLRCNILGGKTGFGADGLQRQSTALRRRWHPGRHHRQDQDHRGCQPKQPDRQLHGRRRFCHASLKRASPSSLMRPTLSLPDLGMSQVQLIKKYKNVMVTRTLSKAYGLAGMRFGYVLGNKDVIGQISAALLPWNVGTIPMWAALAAFEDTEGLQKRVEFNNSEVDFIEESLSDIDGLYSFHSNANYILFDGSDTGKAGKDLVSFARRKASSSARKATMYGRDGWFRITMGSQEENRMAVDVMHEFYSK